MEGARSPALVHVDFPEVPSALLANLNRQREEGTLCDVSIHVQGRVFRAHRAVLAASSPFFHDQVLLKNMTTIVLPGAMDPGAFETVLGSAYTGRLSMAPEDIVNLLTVGSVLQMWHIVDKCTELLRQRRAAPPACAAASSSSSPSRTRACADRHVNMHLNLRPFGCPVCAKKFKMKHHLTEHMKTHTGLKPYACDACAKRFICWDMPHLDIESHHIWTDGYCDPGGGYAQMLGLATSGHPVTSHLD
ncbi:hypothetical protein Q9233_017799 [Columba guinea]|nr:hypothetical protein Q9233_017799 [Columba guinea]